jgi:hypothetical protein
MTIASKSGGLIIKEGALATNCACCETVNPCVDDRSDVTGVVVEISASDYLTQRTRVWDSSPINGDELGIVTQKDSRAAKTSLLNGTHVLTRDFRFGTFSDRTIWSIDLEGQPAECGNITIRAVIYNNPAARFSLNYFISLINMQVISRAERGYERGPYSCGEPQHYDIDTIGECNQFEINNTCLLKHAASNERNASSVCTSGQFTEATWSGRLPGQPMPALSVRPLALVMIPTPSIFSGFGLISWILLSDIEEVNNDPNVVIQSVELIRS